MKHLLAILVACFAISSAFAQTGASMSAADKGDIANNATHADKKAAKARDKADAAEKKAAAKDAKKGR